VKSIPEEAYLNSFSALEVSFAGSDILWATINRPEAQNAINFAVIDELERLVGFIEENEQINAFILSGSGPKAFIAGGDLKEFHSIKDREQAMDMSKQVHELLMRIENLPVWTIACINGLAYGGGIEILLSFDFHIAADSARFGFTQGRFYLTPGWGGLTRLVEKVGKSKAFQLLAEAAVLSAREVQELGIIEKVVPMDDLHPSTLEWAEQLTKNDRYFIERLKKSVNAGRKERLEQLEAEIEPFTDLWIHDKHEQRVEKFIRKD
jgi:enoyl-CoA hydratase/carnithine racemase